jgi:DNA polymerase-3 subunit epsilon
MSRYAVIDIETTGLSPARNHRILEIAVVLVDDDGNVVYEWETLVNPEREVGATEIHGLSAADVYSAPTFSQLAHELKSILAGRVPVAHNLSFDIPFIAAEYARAGYPVALERTSGLCTMRLAPHYLPSGPRTLEACCCCIGCRQEAAHAAINDARATAQLLSYYIRHDDDFVRYWGGPITAAQTIAWPDIPTASVVRVARSDAAVVDEHFLGRLASRTPRSEIHPEANSYLGLLDRVLLDRHVSLHEADELVAAAESMGLAREDAITLHRLYLSSLGRLARADGVVTPRERADLDVVASVLGLDSSDTDAALAPTVDLETADCAVGGFSLSKGDAVVFTGEAPGIDRADLQYQASALGLRVTGGVSGKTRLLVASDPDSLSGKARKARDLGVPIVDYSTYMEMLDNVSR